MATFVKAAPGDTNEMVIRRFNKRVQADGVLAELKKREHFIKRSVMRRLATQLARRKMSRRSA